MNKKYKKIISIVLAFVISISSLTTFANAENRTIFKNKSLKENITITVLSMENKCVTDDEMDDEHITIDVAVTNNSEDIDYDNLVVSMKYNWCKIKCDVGDDLHVGNLRAGETKHFTITVMENDDFLAKRIINYISKTVTYFCKVFWGTYNRIDDYEVDFNDRDYTFVFYAYIDDVDENKMLYFDTEHLTYDSSVGGYIGTSEFEEFTGKLTSLNAAEMLSYEITDPKGYIVCSGSIDIAESWVIKDYSLLDGINNIEVILTKKSGETISETLPYYSDSLFNIENSELDMNDDDKDGLNNYLEAYYGTDKTKWDTDGDGLSDYDELNTLNLNPNAIDTDNNGIIDYDEDNDDDGLKNGYEISIGLSPVSKDSDYDGLLDNEEIDLYKTDPKDEDTDDDGVSDGDEILLGTDPLMKEVSFIESKSYDEVTEDFPVSASVVVNTDSTGAGTLEITPVSQADNPLISKDIPGYLGTAYDFSIEGKINGATITFLYDETLGTPSENFQPRIYYLNEETGELEELPNQTISNGKVTANTSHFSTYILLNKIEFDKAWEEEIKPPEYEGNGMTGIDVVFVIDSSGSMTSNDRNNIRHTAAKNFVDKLGENDRAAVIDFDDSAYLYQSFTNDKDLLYTAIDRVNSSGGTYLSAGMNKAISQFTSSTYSRIDAYKYIVFLTDGSGSYSTSYTTTAANNGIVVYTIGLGSGVNESLLRGIAEGTNGKYYFASTAAELPDIYSDVSFETIDYTTDSNNDGISDYFTKLLDNGELRLSNGSTILDGVIDEFGENDDDWDDDGIKNGEEVKIIVNSQGKVTAKMISNPLYVDSDGDGITDAKEIALKTNPLKKERLGGDVELLLGSDAQYRNIAENVWHTFDFKKTEESEMELINYFYDYASEESILENAKSIEKQKNWEIGINCISALADIAGIIKDANEIAGTIGTDYKAEKKKVNKSKFDIINKINKSTEDLTESELEAVLEAIDSGKSVVDKVSEGVSNAGAVIETVNKVFGLASKITKLSKDIFKYSAPIGKQLKSYAEKYTKFMKKDLGFIKTSTAINIVFEAVDVVTETATATNVFSKIEANSDAFTEYAEIFNFIAYKADTEKFTKDAALKVYEIVLEEGKGYFSEVATLCAKESLEAAVNVGLSIVGTSVPVVGIVVAAWSVIDSLLLGLSADSKTAVKAIVYVAIFDACADYVKKYYRESDNSLAFYFTDEQEGIKYLTQLAQCSIIGNEYAKEYFSNFSVAKWIAMKIDGWSSKKDYIDMIDDVTTYYYKCAEDQALHISNKLPGYPKDYDATNPWWVEAYSN